VSIAEGIKCQDGIVLSADREMLTDTYRYCGANICGIALAKGSFLMAQAAKDVDDIPRLYERLSSKLIGCPKDVQEIQEVVQNALADLREWSPENIDHQALIAVGVPPSEPVLWKSSNAKISPVLLPWTLIGFGESALTHYLMRALLKCGMTLTVRQAAICSIYVLAQAKQHIPGCGSTGPTEVVILRSDGVTSVVPYLSVEAIERELGLLEYHASLSFSKVADRRLNPAYVEKSINEFAGFIRDLRAKLNSLDL
jgi:hypothetical protein